MLVFLYSLDLTISSFNSSEYVFEFPHFIGFSDPLLFLYGPLTYLFFSSLISDTRHSTFHFLPSIIVCIISFVFIYFQQPDVKLILNESTSSSSYDELIEFRNSLWFISMIHNIIYLFQSFNLLYRHTLKSSAYAVFKQLLLLQSLFLVLTLLLFYVDWFYDMLPIISLFSSSCVLYFLGYYSLRHQDIYNPLQTKKYEKDLLPSEHASRIIHTLEHYFTTRKPFLNATLKLNDISNELNISANHISQAINSQLNQTFSECVNRYRVEHAKELINSTKYSNLTLSAIGLESGFNSKTSFYNHFKKVVGMSPAEYKKSRETDSNL